MTSERDGGPGTLASRYRAASALSAVIAPFLITIGLTAYGLARWDNPLGIVWYSLFFVLPFTVVGSFGILWPVHRLLGRLADWRVLSGLVLLTGALVGGGMLSLLRAGWPLFIMGFFSGACTAAIWLLAFHLVGSTKGTA